MPAMRAGAALIRVTSVAEVERLGLHQLAVQHAEGRLEADGAEGRLLVGHLLLLGDVRCVIGGDAVDEAALERPARSAARSLSSRSGGFILRLGSSDSRQTSVRVRWCGVTSP